MFYPNIPGQNKKKPRNPNPPKRYKNPPIKYRNIKTIEIISKKADITIYFKLLLLC